MEIKGKIVYPVNQSTEYVNGAFGGMNNHGEILIHFFKDINNLPNSVSLNIEEGQIPQDIFPVDNGFNRNVVSSIILSPETAEVIATWLLQNVNQIQTFKNQQDSNNGK